MKRKITFAIVALASSLMSVANADGFGTLVFKSANGETYSLEAKDLEIYYKDGNITFNNDKRIIPVSTLVSMEFSDNPADNTAVEKLFTDTTGPVTVYSIDGIKTGKFQSLSEAYQSLKPGLYVVRLSNGETIKIEMKK